MTHVTAHSRAGRWWSQVRIDPATDTSRVIPIAVGLIVLQLLYRGWASYHSYWEGDDFIFINNTFAPGGRSLHTLLSGLSGHVMPGGLYLSWWINHLSPYDYRLATLTLTLLQALASLGLLRFLLVAFGKRWGILAPLVVYLATAFTVQGTVWFGPGIHSLPFQVALFWALTAHVQYLQTGRARYAVVATLWVALGLLFYEKTLLVLGALLFVTLAYFTTGTMLQRLGQVWRRYRVSLLLSLGLGLAYLGVYAAFGLNFSPGEATNYPIGPTADVMILRNWAAAVFGGPLRWTRDPAGPLSISAPLSLLVVLCWVALGLVIRELVRSRSRSLRALWLPGFFLASDVLLVVASRATVLGPVVGFEFRYIEEMAAVTALALAFATMPVLGALEPVELKRPSPLLDRRRPATLACVAVALLGTWSTFGYFHNWHTNQPAKSFFQNLIADVHQLPEGTPVVDTTVPGNVLWPLSFPKNTLSHLLRPLPVGIDYAAVGTDRLMYLAPDGHLGQLDVTSVHRAPPVVGSECGYRVGARMRAIPLDGPFVFGGWWVRVRYIATADTPITVRAGGLTHHTSVSAGLHTLYFMAGGDRFQSITMGHVGPGAHLCTQDVTVGRAVVQGAS